MSNKDINIWISTFNVQTHIPPKNGNLSLYDWIESVNSNIDIVAIGLQEAAPLTMKNVLIGPGDYMSHWTKTISELLSVRLSKCRMNNSDDQYRFVLLKKSQLIGICSLIFIKYKYETITEEWKSCIDVQSSYISQVRTGIMNQLGNKGSIAISLEIDNLKYCFINTHMAAHVEMVSRRNEDAKNILQQTKFPIESSDHNLIRTLTLTDFDLIFFFGDLNYRLEPHRLLERKSIINLLEKSYLMNNCSIQLQLSIAFLFQSYDQLNIERRERKLLSGFREEFPLINLTNYDENYIRKKLRKTNKHLDKLVNNQLKEMDDMKIFLPTYRYNKSTVCKFDTSEKQRIPAWTDRILYKTSHRFNRKFRISVLKYSSIQEIIISDHKPVFAIFNLTFRRRSYSSNSTPSSKRQRSNNNLKIVKTIDLGMGKDLWSVSQSFESMKNRQVVKQVSTFYAANNGIWTEFEESLENEKKLKKCMKNIEKNFPLLIKDRDIQKLLEKSRSFLIHHQIRVHIIDETSFFLVKCGKLKKKQKLENDEEIYENEQILSILLIEKQSYISSSGLLKSHQKQIFLFYPHVNLMSILNNFQYQKKKGMETDKNLEYLPKLSVNFLINFGLEGDEFVTLDGSLKRTFLTLSLPELLVLEYYYYQDLGKDEFVKYIEMDVNSIENNRLKKIHTNWLQKNIIMKLLNKLLDKKIWKLAAVEDYYTKSIMNKIMKQIYLDDEEDCQLNYPMQTLFIFIMLWLVTMSSKSCSKDEYDKFMKETRQSTYWQFLKMSIHQIWNNRNGSISHSIDHSPSIQQQQLQQPLPLTTTGTVTTMSPIAQNENEIKISLCLKLLESFGNFNYQNFSSVESRRESYLISSFNSDSLSHMNRNEISHNFIKLIHKSTEKETSIFFTLCRQYLNIAYEELMVDDPKLFIIITRLLSYSLFAHCDKEYHAPHLFRNRSWKILESDLDIENVTKAVHHLLLTFDYTLHLSDSCQY
ncbi:hypothetical protein SNEBB_001373 [Seison nebaliae]|nr:hypothetical protein SNEBB_001373 [Seison nebaliae]